MKSQHRLYLPLPPIKAVTICPSNAEEKRMPTATVLFRLGTALMHMESCLREHSQPWLTPGRCLPTILQPLLLTSLPLRSVDADRRATHIPSSCCTFSAPHLITQTLLYCFQILRTELALQNE